MPTRKKPTAKQKLRSKSTAKNAYTIDKTDSWKLYNPLVPQGMMMIGTVRRGAGDAGALAHVMATGRYVQLNANASRNLDQRKVKEALAALR